MSVMTFLTCTDIQKLLNSIHSISDLNIKRRLRSSTSVQVNEAEGTSATPLLADFMFVDRLKSVDVEKLSNEDIMKMSCVKSRKETTAKVIRTGGKGRPRYDLGKYGMLAKQSLFYVLKKDNRKHSCVTRLTGIFRWKNCSAVLFHASSLQIRFPRKSACLGTKCTNDLGSISNTSGRTDTRRYRRIGCLASTGIEKN